MIASVCHLKGLSGFSLVLAPPLKHTTGSYQIRASKFRRAAIIKCSLEVVLPTFDKPIRFPATGSGLLWARSTGLKVWTGAKALSSFMVNTRILQSHLTNSVQSPAVLSPETAGAPISTWSWEDKVVLELGCGLGLCSITAALLGAKVIATDGDADLVALAKKNIPFNTLGCKYPVTVRTLSWGDPNALLRTGLGQGSTADVILLSDVIYGSNPGVWEKLAHTILDASSDQSVVLQCESFRKEGLLYDEYWKYMHGLGFRCDEVDGAALDCPPGVCRLWVVRHRMVNDNTA